MDKLFSNYEMKLSGQMVNSVGKSIIRIYSMEACAVLGMSSQEALSEDLESDSFPNSTLQRFWFGIGVILAITIVESLEYCVEVLLSSSSN